MTNRPFLREAPLRRQFVSETPFVLGSIFLLTVIIMFFHLSTRVPDSLLFYLLVILVFACMRGLRAALLASFVAFITFDYLFVPPVYGFGATKLEDIVALAFFLIATVITSQLASSLRTRILQARKREYEARTLYEFVRATNRERDSEQQLFIFVKALVEVFASEGLRDCMVLLPDASGELRPQRSALQLLQNVPLLADEEIAAGWVMLHARSLDLYHSLLPLPATLDARLAKRRRRTSKTSRSALIRLIPLKTETKVYAVLRLLFEENRDAARSRNRLGIEQPPLSAHTLFFSTFLEQAITIIEQEHLREASIHLEVLQQTEVLRSALFSSVSHDLRTPLATIKASVSNLLQEETRQVPDTSQSATRTIEREVDRLDGLVENLLDMSRIEAGSLRLEKVWYPLDELISDTVSHLQTHLGEREVKMSYPDDLPPIELDIVQIEQVIFNLLENALRYTPEGSPIEVRIQRQEEALQVSVADRGPGIPLTEREPIFTKFYRIAQNGHPQGLGLGLAICQGIIQAHEGQIWVETREGGGSAFCFTLPAREIEASEIDEQRESTYSRH